MDKLMSYKFWLAALALLLVPMFFTSCEDIVETDEELLPFFDMFAEEGAERGFLVDYEAARIEGEIQNISTANVLGQCFRNEDKPRKVIVDRDYWEEANEMEKQFLIFHELGHCFLDRNHLDQTFQGTNICISIMHSTPQACDFELTEENREEYLDELFR